MKNILVLFCTLLSFAPLAQAKLNVVATMTDFAAIAQEIGGDKVSVISLAKGTEDPHFADARPSFVSLLNKADLLLEGGAELEIGWITPVLNNARNPKILPGGVNNLRMSSGVQLLEVPTGPIDRSMGDVHPLGNPHYYLDPANGGIMAEHITEAFCWLDATNAELYRENLRRFKERLEKKMTEWKERLAPFRGTKMLTYHKSYEYFTERFGLEVTGQLQPKPGIEPSPTHINALIPLAKEQGVKLIVIEPFRPRKKADFVAKAIGAKLLVLPDRVGGNAESTDFFNRFDYIVDQITKALK
jgi:zinc/manganese transport system substrate-binding protein